ncbi:hypothetical protein [Candidatus Uabimicrobium sp. HlEnr_7]|uniref:hypothetical protein n=1 Tax=Candidatus Uabimicrobium helgolandensis TaxID=3095367 RepID=UPI0035566965
MVSDCLVFLRTSPNGLQLKPTTKNNWQKVCVSDFDFQINKEKEFTLEKNYDKDGEIKLRTFLYYARTT